MVRGQKASINGIELFLCPFTDIFITQGPNEQPSHEGTMSMDVRGLEPGVRYPYYAPCTCKLINLYTETNTAVWQSIDKVRLSNGVIDYMTFCTAHDNTFDAKIGQVIPQGSKLGNLGDYSQKGDVTGVHCHIEHSRSWDSERVLNQYGNWHFKYELDPEDVWFMDNTNILNGLGNWKYAGNLYIGNPVERSLGVDQVEVFTDKFYPTGRKEPMGDISGFVKSGFYNILETKQQNNLTWVKVADDLWFDLGNEWAKVLPKGDVTEDQVIIKELENKIKVLEDRILELTEERNVLIENKPTLVFTCIEPKKYLIKLRENEKLYIGL